MKIISNLGMKFLNAFLLKPFSGESLQKGALPGLVMASIAVVSSYTIYKLNTSSDASSSNVKKSEIKVDAQAMNEMAINTTAMLFANKILRVSNLTTNTSTVTVTDASASIDASNNTGHPNWTFQSQNRRIAFQFCDVRYLRKFSDVNNFSGGTTLSSSKFFSNQCMTDSSVPKVTTYVNFTSVKDSYLYLTAVTSLKDNSGVASTTTYKATSAEMKVRLRVSSPTPPCASYSDSTKNTGDINGSGGNSNQSDFEAFNAETLLVNFGSNDEDTPDEDYETVAANPGFFQQIFRSGKASSINAIYIRRHITLPDFSTANSGSGLLDVDGNCKASANDVINLMNQGKTDGWVSNSTASGASTSNDINFNFSCASRKVYTYMNNGGTNFRWKNIAAGNDRFYDVNDSGIIDGSDLTDLLNYISAFGDGTTFTNPLYLELNLATKATNAQDGLGNWGPLYDVNGDCLVNGKDAQALSAKLTSQGIPNTIPPALTGDYPDENAVESGITLCASGTSWKNTVSGKLADVNGDGYVDFYDTQLITKLYNSLSSNTMGPTAGPPYLDLNGDCKFSKTDVDMATSAAGAY